MGAYKGLPSKVQACGSADNERTTARPTIIASVQTSAGARGDAMLTARTERNLQVKKHPEDGGPRAASRASSSVTLRPNLSRLACQSPILSPRIIAGRAYSLNPMQSVSSAAKDRLSI